MYSGSTDLQVLYFAASSAPTTKWMIICIKGRRFSLTSPRKMSAGVPEEGIPTTDPAAAGSTEEGKFSTDQPTRNREVIPATGQSTRMSAVEGDPCFLQPLPSPLRAPKGLGWGFGFREGTASSTPTTKRADNTIIRIRHSPDEVSGSRIY